MTVSAFDNGGYYLHISQDEIESGDGIESIIGNLKNTGVLPVCSSLCEVFPSDRGGALVFARNLFGFPLVYTFSNFSEALKTISCFEDDTVSFLACAEDTYYFVYYPADYANSPIAADDYATPSPANPNFLYYLAEHGSGVLGPNAAHSVRQYFL